MSRLWLCWFVLISSCAERALPWAAATDLAVPHDLRSVDLADLGPGSPDAACGDACPGLVLTDRYRRPAGASFVVVDDFDGDGHLDAVTTDFQGGDVAFFRGLGDGRFARPVFSAAMVRPYSLVQGDLDGDGRLDLVVEGLSSPETAILLGRGDGTFLPPTIFSIKTEEWLSVRLADFTGDGILDLFVWPWRGSDGFRLFAGRGDGSFAAPTITAAPASITGIALADFDHNGRVDVAALSDGHLTVFFGHGDGSFLPPVDYPAPAPYNNSVDSLELADLDHDGELDLSFSLGRQVYWGGHDGSFVQAPVNTAQPRTGGVGTAADLDGDGWPDLVAILSEQVIVAVNDRHGQFQPARTTPLAGIDGLGDFSPTVVLGDFDEDGHPDLITPTVPGLATLPGNGDGTFGEPHYVTVDGAEQLFYLDVDQDGIGDLVVGAGGETELGQKGAVTFRHGRGDGHFDPPVDFVGPAASPFGLPIALGDFDGDGRVDVMANGRAAHAGLSFFTGDGQGGFGAARTAWPSYFDPLLTADFDHNGTLDLIGFGQEGFSSLSGQGNGRFAGGGPIAASASCCSEYYLLARTVADFNHDGAPDVLLANDLGFEVVLGHGDGTFAASRLSKLGGTPLRLTVGDFDGDGVLDVAASIASGISVSLGRGDGTFAAPVGLDAGVTWLIGAADFDGDGPLDLVGVSQSGPLLLFRGRGDGTFEPQPFHPPVLGNYIESSGVLGDFDGDGRMDVAVAHRSTNTLDIYMNRFAR